jgi:hypothetical protein
MLTGVIAGATFALFVPAPASAQQSGQGGGQQQDGQQQFKQQPSQQQYGQQGQQRQRMQQQFGQAQQPIQGEGAPLYVSPNEVMQVQTRLSQMGLNPGQTDGRWGSQTKEALENFQRQHGLSPTGNLNLTTLSALGVQLGQSGQFLGLGQQQPGRDMQQQQRRGMGMRQPGMVMQQRGTGMQRGWGQSGQGGGQQNGYSSQQDDEDDQN